MCAVLCPNSFDNGPGQLIAPFLKYTENARRLLSASPDESFCMALCRGGHVSEQYF